MECTIPKPKTGLRKGFKNWKHNGTRFTKKVGELPFEGPIRERALEYNTIGGPFFYHKDVVTYGNSAHNLGVALNRLDVAREGEASLVYNNLKIAPGNCRGLSRYLDSYYRKVRHELRPELYKLGGTLTEQIRTATDPTHIKYCLRRWEMARLLERENLATSLYMRKVAIKIKIPEAAKAGKGTRAIGDFSCPGSLLAPFLVPPLKHAFATRVEHDGCTIVFCESTDAATIDELFTEMYRSTGNFFIYFSDDMVCKVFRNGVPEYYNLDISSCDKSQTRAVFLRLKWFYAGTAWEELIEKAISQCESPIYMKNPHDATDRITAQTLNPTEFSGTILTTVLNNIAAAAICLSINYSLARGSLAPTAQLVADSAFAVGYAVTAEPCAGPEDLQFLKMSFWVDEEKMELHSFLNLGAIIRSFGSTWMDYPYNRKKGERLEDAVRFRNWSVLQGYKHVGSTDLYAALLSSPGCQRSRMTHSKVIERHVALERAHKHWDSESARQAVPRTAILRRYGISDCEYTELCTLAARADVGHYISTVAVDRILHKDYGYAL